MWKEEVMYRIAGAGDINVFSPASLAGYVATAIGTVIGFLITVLILKKLLYKPLLAMIERRQQKATSLLTEASDRAAAAAADREQVKTEVETRLNEAGAQAASIKKRGEQEAAALVKEAQSQAAAIRAKAETERQQRLAADEKRIYHQAVDLAMAAVTRYLADQGNRTAEYEQVNLILSDLVRAEQNQQKEESGRQNEE